MLNAAFGVVLIGIVEDKRLNLFAVSFVERFKL